MPLMTYVHLLTMVGEATGLRYYVM